MNPAPAGFFVYARAAAVALLFCVCAITTSAQENIPLDGEHVFINAVTFKGNTVFTDDELLAHIQTQPSPSYLVRKFFFAPANFINSVMLVQDSSALVDLYRDNGFLFVTVGFSFVIDTPKVEGVVNFFINEGRRCVVDSVVVGDSARLTASERATVNDLFSKLAGHLYNKNTLRDTLNAAINFLQDHGYRFARPVGSPLVLLDHALTGVTIKLEIFPGEKYRFGRAEVFYDSTSQGKCFAEAAVRAELEFNAGDFYSRTKAYRTEDNLRRLGVFEIVRVELLTGDVDPATRITPTHVFLKLRKEIEFSPDFVTDNQYATWNAGVNATLIYHNVFCAAQELSLSGTYEIPITYGLKNSLVDLNAKFYQPRIRLGDLLNYRNTSLTFVGDYKSQTIPFPQQVYTLSTQLNIKQAAYTFLIPQIAFVEVRTDTNNLLLRQNAAVNYLLSTTQIVPKQPNLLLSIAVTRDNTNNLFVPTEGSSGVLSFKWNVLNTPNFWKVEGTQKWYVAWGTQSVFAFRFHGGLIGRWGDVQKDILLEEKFYVGGAYSLRGWRLYELGIGIDDSIKTGYAVLEGNVEWRYQWFRLPDRWYTRLLLNRISTSFFLDCGDLWSERTMAAWVPEMYKQVAIAAGVGFRYDTPVGPLRIDLGYKIYDPITGEFPRLANFYNQYPYIHLTHPTVQVAIGNAF